MAATASSSFLQPCCRLPHLRTILSSSSLAIISIPFRHYRSHYSVAFTSSLLPLISHTHTFPHLSFATVTFSSIHTQSPSESLLQFSYGQRYGEASLQDAEGEDEPEQNSSPNLEIGKNRIYLTKQEKKGIASYAHSIERKLKVQQIGKLGVTTSVITSFTQILEANELLKVKIFGSCPVELSDAVKEIEERTGCMAVHQIGRVVILYRPSLKKLEAEERRKLAKERAAHRELKLLQKAKEKPSSTKMKIKVSDKHRARREMQQETWCDVQRKT